MNFEDTGIPLDPLFELDIETVIALSVPPPPRPPPVPVFSSSSSKRVRSWVDLSPYYGMPQLAVAKKFGMAISTLSRRWRLVSGGRLWPYRRVRIIDKKLEALGQSDPEKKAKLERKRQVLLTPVTIDTSLCEDWAPKVAIARRSKKRARDDDDEDSLDSGDSDD